MFSLNGFECRECLVTWINATWDQGWCSAEGRNIIGNCRTLHKQILFSAVILPSFVPRISADFSNHNDSAPLQHRLYVNSHVYQDFRHHTRIQKLKSVLLASFKHPDLRHISTAPHLHFWLMAFTKKHILTNPAALFYATICAALEFWNKHFLCQLITMSTSQAAIVTGGASGLGLEITKFLLSQGWSVVIADINAAGETVAKSLGSEILFIKADTSIWEQQVEMFEKGTLAFCFHTKY